MKQQEWDIGVLPGMGAFGIFFVGMDGIETVAMWNLQWRCNPLNDKIGQERGNTEFCWGVHLELRT